jgi:hypothetical protein
VAQLATGAEKGTPPSPESCAPHWYFITDGPQIIPGTLTVRSRDVLARIKVQDFNLNSSAHRLAPLLGYQGDGVIEIQLDSGPALVLDNQGHGTDNDFSIGFKNLPDGNHKLRISIVSVTGRVLGYTSSCFAVPANRTISVRELAVP